RPRCVRARGEDMAKEHGGATKGLRVGRRAIVGAGVALLAACAAPAPPTATPAPAGAPGAGAKPSAGKPAGPAAAPTSPPAAPAAGWTAASTTYTPIATIKPEIKREGLILANIEDTYGHAAGMEAVAKDYMALYPKVEIKVDPKPIEGYFDWAKAQVIG